MGGTGGVCGLVGGTGREWVLVGGVGRVWGLVCGTGKQWGLVGETEGTGVWWLLEAKALSRWVSLFTGNIPVPLKPA